MVDFFGSRSFFLRPFIFWRPSLLPGIYGNPELTPLVPCGWRRAVV